MPFTRKTDYVDTFHAEDINELQIAIEELLGGDTPFDLDARLDIIESTGVYNVKHTDYGAVGDGVTNDTAAIQAAVDDIPLIGGTLLFPPGRYRVNSSVVFGSTRVTIEGGVATGQWDDVGRGGSQIVVAGGVEGFVFGDADDYDTYNGPTIRNIWFTGDGSTAGSGGIKLLRVNNYMLENVRFGEFLGAGSYGLNVDGTGGYSQYGTLVECGFFNCMTGLTSTEASGIVLAGGHFDGNDNGTGDPASHPRDIGSKGVELLTGTEGFRAFGARMQFYDTGWSVEGGENHQFFGTRNEACEVTFHIAADRVGIFGGSINNFLMASNPTVPETETTGVNITAAADYTQVKGTGIVSTTDEVTNAGTNTTMDLDTEIDTSLIRFVGSGYIGGSGFGSGNIDIVTNAWINGECTVSAGGLSSALFFGYLHDTSMAREDANLLAMAAGDSFKVDGTYNGGMLRLGAYYLWVDNTGDLRIKSGAPSTHDDGTVVGAQT
jgi:hypothetical protein